MKSKSPEAFDKNLKTEMHAGKPLKQSLAIAYAMKRKAKKMAHGGMVHEDEMESGYESEPEVHDPEMQHDDMDADLVDRIMRKRVKMMPEGGVVADEGMGDPMEHADQDSAYYDYLSSGDLDDHTTNSGAADGDFLGNEREDEDRHDIVSRIMRSRAKKDRMPRPA